MPGSQPNAKGVSSRVFCKVNGRTEMIVVPDATQPVRAARTYRLRYLSFLIALRCSRLIVQPSNARDHDQVSKLVDMVNARFGTRVGRLAIMDCELRWV